ncbi:MAG TPA: phosphatidylglycerophosphatase A, partial [Bacteroidota bacterium]|nr:phosphatidylglycerophosphatase A [Bacteroidota bacterium]
SAARVAEAVGHRIQGTAKLAKTHFQGEAPGHPDPSIVVIDEIVGMWIALLFVPTTLPAVLIAFTTFRLFDIVKPPPAAGLERYGRGWGIMLDDVVAGAYACIVTHLTLRLIG